ncbi:MAG TPA: signal peptidase II [Pelolinea sp.]|nr:signal peptidase II [Pelolinea sp.]
MQKNLEKRSLKLNSLKNLKSYAILLPITGLIVFLDQWTKAIVRANLQLGDVWSPFEWLTPYARIVHWFNTGVAFGMFQDKNLLFSALVFLISLSIFIFYPKLTEDDWFLRIALSMQLGGSIGNLIDRMTMGHVTDFISVGNFPVFNIADSCITVGAIIMIIGLWVEERKEKSRHLNQDKYN